MCRYRTCLRLASTEKALASVSGTESRSRVPTRVPTGFLTSWARGLRNPAWLWLFLRVCRPCRPPLACSRELPPERMVSDNSDMERRCTPCADAAKPEVAGGMERRRVDRKVSTGFGGRNWRGSEMQSAATDIISQGREADYSVQVVQQAVWRGSGRWANCGRSCANGRPSRGRKPRRGLCAGMLLVACRQSGDTCAPRQGIGPQSTTTTG